MDRASAVRFITGIAVLIAGASAQRTLAGDLGDRLAERGLTVLAEEAGTTGRHSTYHGRTIDRLERGELPRLGDDRVRFGHGPQPSPGGSTGRHFDEGALACRLDRAANTLTVAVAAGADPQRWYRAGSFARSPHGQGDLFVDVLTRGGDVLHFALLNPMDEGRDVGHKGLYRQATELRHTGRAKPGDLVRITREEHIAKSGGRRGFERHGNSPRGLDERVLAQGGTVVDGARLERYEVVAHQPLINNDDTWYVSQWTLPLAALGTAEDPAKVLALHIATTCGNDQIGAVLELDDADAPLKPAGPSIH